MNVEECAILCEQAYTGGKGWIDVGDLRFGVFNDILCFRGSANAENWLRDVSVFPARSMKGYLAHAGFVNAMAKLWSDVLKVVPDINKITVTGHSLGAAIAVLFAEAMNRPVVTFGCPRVYFLLSKPPKMQHERYICDDDPVPMVPRILFKHTCDPKQILTDIDNELINPKDHNISVYIKRLKGAAT